MLAALIAAMLTVEFGGATARADQPEACGDSGFCYAGYSAKGLKTIAEDLSANGKDSWYYAEMKSAMDADTKGTLKVTSTAIANKGQQVDMPVRLIGILHDNKADGTGRAGLTFQTYSSLPRAYCMNGVMPDNDDTTQCADGITNKGGWRDSGLRKNMNGGEIWESMPADLRDALETVAKTTNNTGYYKRAVATGTNDKLWLVSYREYVKTMYDGWEGQDGFQALSQEGSQYGFYDGRVVNNQTDNTILDTLWAVVPSWAEPAGAFDAYAWERSSNPLNSGSFLLVSSYGNPSDFDPATYRYGVAPAFCL